MTVSIQVADSEKPLQFFLGEVVTSAEWATSLWDQPGKLTFDVIETHGEYFYEGANVVLEVDSTKLFDGYVFVRKRTESTISVTAYDRIRYLQNKDTKVFENSSLNEIFTTICTEQQLKFKIVKGSTYKTAPVAHDNKAYYQMIKRALDESFLATNQYIQLRDSAGQLELVDIADLVTDLVLGDASLVTGFQFTSSIDEQTYNYIKLVQENKKAKKRDVYVAMDSNNIRKWGRLQYFEKVDEEMNEAQIKARTDQFLKLYNRKTKSLKISAIGDIRVREGCGIGLAISQLENEGIPYLQYAFIVASKHRFQNDLHTMDLDIEVV